MLFCVAPHGLMPIWAHMTLYLNSHHLSSLEFPSLSLGDLKGLGVFVILFAKINGEQKSFYIHKRISLKFAVVHDLVSSFGTVVKRLPVKSCIIRS